MHDVNVVGTQHVIQSCIENGVARLVYTSTGSVVVDGSDIKVRTPPLQQPRRGRRTRARLRQDGDESMEYPERHLDVYSSTKAAAEKLVLAANGRLTGQGARVRGTRVHTLAVSRSEQVPTVHVLVATAHDLRAPR
jgi:nucleoside-diphosphate-sugar epimerase